ncbi:sortase [Rhodospirillaceae bacterium KN72]|uniref:Sortase n=1 Tax=Pacificispira spongiicola TaxID=2729598 RepID=A0A7Y0HFI5_9PROT|nr:sortase [Pacificispira spongiicola]NMM44618.1 sortase [Pacificispira spongiicola]
MSSLTYEEAGPKTRIGRLSRRRAVVFASGMLAAVGLWQIGETGMILGKAWLAPILIEDAWTARREAAISADGEVAGAYKPWPWADTEPVARLVFPRQGVSRIALSGATGRNMAFGPTLSENAPLPAFFGHRDTHFALLAGIAAGDPILWEHPDGTVREYRVSETAVMRKDRIQVPVGDQTDRIVLVTCYPFDALTAGGDDRFVVLAEAVPPEIAMAGQETKSSEP